MSDTDQDDGFDKAFENFGEEPKQPETPSAEPPKKDEEPTPPAPADDKQPKEGEDDANKDKPSDKPEGTPPASDSKPAASEGDKPPSGEEKPGEGKPAEADAPKDEGTPPAPEEPKPLTEEAVKDIIQNLRTEERTSGKELDATTKDVMDAYYPDGLSNVLVDQATGKELRTPQDVVDASGGEMSVEQAAQWLMNEQFKLDKQISEIKDDAKRIAETTLNFKRDSMVVLQKYDPLFKAYPHLQKKAFDLMMKQVKADEKKGVILSAPDVIDLYDTYLEPYQLAFEHSTQQSATNNTTPSESDKPPAPTPGTSDRLDESGDAGATPPDDPNDFAQQVSKELAKDI